MAGVTILRLSGRQRLALYDEDGTLVGAVGFSCPAAVMRMRPALAEARPLAEVTTDLLANQGRRGRRRAHCRIVSVPTRHARRGW
jgi:hypothetical protein